MFECVCLLANSVGNHILDHIGSLLDLMFSVGLCEPLRKTCTSLSEAIPLILFEIQGKYLEFDFDFREVAARDFHYFIG